MLMATVVSVATSSKTSRTSQGLMVEVLAVVRVMAVIAVTVGEAADVAAADLPMWATIVNNSSVARVMTVRMRMMAKVVMHALGSGAVGAGVSIAGTMFGHGVSAYHSLSLSHVHDTSVGR